MDIDLVVTILANHRLVHVISQMFFIVHEHSGMTVRKARNEEKLKCKIHDSVYKIKIVQLNIVCSCLTNCRQQS